jgi:hypothetical protein
MFCFAFFFFFLPGCAHNKNGGLTGFPNLEERSSKQTISRPMKADNPSSKLLWFIHYQALAFFFFSTL